MRSTAPQSWVFIVMLVLLLVGFPSACGTDVIDEPCNDALDNRKLIGTSLDWESVPLPTVSHFAGFPVPDDAARWAQAVQRAAAGEQVLLKKIMETIKTPYDFLRHDDEYRGVTRLAEIERCKDDGWLENLPPNKGSKAHIVGLGFRVKLDHRVAPNKVPVKSMNPREIIRNDKWNISRRIVGIGIFNENWGYLSTTFLNRSVGWRLTFKDSANHMDPDFQLGHQQFSRFVDDPNLVMLVVNQHHNFTQEKVISVPLGVPAHVDTFNAIRNAMWTNQRKDTFILTAGSNFFFRPKLRECVLNALGPSLVVANKTTQAQYLVRMPSAYFVFAPPGLGADTYRLWEALALGCVPIAERGMGLDRSYYKLPVLLVDDFIEITELLLRQAYIEAVYWADSWEYERLTQRYWEHLIYQVSEDGNISYLLKKHPMTAVDLGFTRPLVPFDCAAMGGCGPGTKRTPPKSCAIDPSVIDRDYNFYRKG